MNRQTAISDVSATAQSGAKVFHWPLAYDLMLRILWRGSQQRYRDQTIDLAGVGPGDAVLDVGCGTGTLALVARQRVGATGTVSGVDVSPEMIARARSKAGRAAVEVDFRIASAEALPFRDASFDTVVSTTVLHCLPRAARQKCLAEMVRVVKPGGRLLAIDFGGPSRNRRSWMARWHPHRTFDLQEVIATLREFGLAEIRSGSLGFSDLQFALAIAR